MRSCCRVSARLVRHLNIRIASRGRRWSSGDNRWGFDVDWNVWRVGLGRRKAGLSPSRIYSVGGRTLDLVTRLYMQLVIRSVSEGLAWSMKHMLTKISAASEVLKRQSSVTKLKRSRDLVTFTFPPAAVKTSTSSWCLIRLCRARFEVSVRRSSHQLLLHNAGQNVNLRERENVRWCHRVCTVDRHK